MLTVAELLDDGSLGLQLVAGRAAVDREIEAAAVSELAHPGPWLQGGELLLTIGLLLPDNTDGCRSYIGELDGAGVRAIGLGLGTELPHQRAPERLITAADELGMPLLTVPDPVPFIAVTKAVFAYRARAERQELERILQTQRALTAAAVSPGGLLGILAAHREATGRAGVVVDQLGRVLAQTDPGGDRLVERMSGLLDVRARPRSRRRRGRHQRRPSARVARPGSAAITGVAADRRSGGTACRGPDHRRSGLAAVAGAGAQARARRRAATRTGSGAGPAGPGRGGRRGGGSLAGVARLA